MLRLWCWELCAQEITRFRFSCLSCRLRRRWYGKYQLPRFYVKYTFRNAVKVFIVDSYSDGVHVYTAPEGRKLKVVRRYHVLIDPSRFLMLRCAAIKVLDAVVGVAKRNKPFVEFAEFIANYP